MAALRGCAQTPSRCCSVLAQTSAQWRGDVVQLRQAAESPLWPCFAKNARLRQIGRRPRRAGVATAAYPQGTRLARALASVPRRLDRYFKDDLFRQALWCAISAFAGFYSGNMVTLTFGALAVNDVVAAVVTVAFCEVTSRSFYESWPDAPLYLWFANFFKTGVIFAFMADAYKLGG